VVEPVSLQLGKVVSGLEKMLGRLVGADVKISMSLAPNLWKVTADVGQLEQVIVNLVANARDAMPKGGRITIEARNVTVAENASVSPPDLKAGPYVLLAVTDTGGGIPANVMSHLFEPFFTTKEPGRGTGLGLSTAHGIVKQAGGAIQVTSEVGRGTCFKVYLPQGAKETRVRSMVPEAKPQSARCATILIVEDQESVRHLASTILGSTGHKVLVANDGAEALRISEEHDTPIHLLLSDLVLRTMSGVELGGLIRRLHPEARLLLMSGYAYRSAELHDLIAAGLPFLEKPFTVDGLRQKVAEVLEGPAPHGA
jgi:CheY-like chemotaxis protein